MTVRELREKFLAFFEANGHRRHPSGSVVPYDVTGRLDESLLFNGAGMIQFKPYFRGAAKPDHPRLTTVQKCVRTGDIEEVGDGTHLTFFEMLGNFSFGDYFKAEAIRLSWEFLTDPRWLGLDPARLAFTVFEEDEEAEATWRACGAERVFRLDEETNYWPAGAFSSGPPGPCGPNSEMFFYVGPGEPPPADGYDAAAFQADEAAGRWVEIWNDVFIQYEWQGEPSPDGRAWVKRGMPDLPFRSIDTGMGLERTAFVLAGQKSVYDTEGFQAIFAAVPNPSAADERAVRARRIVADHVRTAVFCVADGVLPGNVGRGYVLRRLLRRAILQGRRGLGATEPFLERVAAAVVAEYGDVYPELRQNSALVAETLGREEAAFGRTLAAGTSRLEELLTAGSVSAEDAFRLYDTFGFPFEVTKEIAAESGASVDEEGYAAEMARAQERSRGASAMEAVYGGVAAADEVALPDAPSATEFVGYSSEHGEGRIVRVRRRGEGGLLVALDRTPFYGESGGQTGDAGTLLLDGAEIAVRGTTRSGGVFWHEIVADAPAEDLLGRAVEARVDEARRAATERNHTATHLLHAALRRRLGTGVAQAGSYVGPDRLRFDFTFGRAVSREELAAIEREVNEAVLAGTLVLTHADLPLDEARARGAMALFGEKYGERVRMVEIGDLSRELCGGTHVSRTSDVGLFLILSEASAAAGIRRIEAVTGLGAYDVARERGEILRAAGERLKAAGDLLGAIERLDAAVRDERRRRERAERAALSGGGEEAEIVEIGGIALWRRDFGEADAAAARERTVAAAAEGGDRLAIGASHADGKVQLVAKASPGAIARGVHAGEAMKAIATAAGGGGGGRPDFATAGAKDPARIPAALAAAETVLRGVVGA